MNNISKREMRRIKKKRKQLAKNSDRGRRSQVVESSASRWIKITAGSVALLIALVVIPVGFALWVLLATIPEIIRDLNLIPSTVTMVITGTIGLLTVQSGLIAAIVMGVLRIRRVRSGMIVTFVISLISLVVLLSFLAPVFRFRGVF